MKKKNYNIIFASSHESKVMQWNLSHKMLSFIVTTSVLGAGLLLLFLTHYFSLNVDQWKLKSLTQENQELKKDFKTVESKLQSLENEVRQLDDFSKKLKLITTGSTHNHNSNLGFGKVSEDTIFALSKPTAQRAIAASEVDNKDPAYPSEKVAQQDYQNLELEVRIDHLKEKSQLVQQDTWDIYTSLLEQSNFINNTPSIAPAKGWVSSRYGYRNELVYVDHQPKFHKGLDVASQHGEPVVATADGKVVFTGYDEFGYGNVIIVDHGFGLKTYYAHLSKIKTERGSYVKRGEQIGTVGNTGKSTGPHLHYEVRIHGKAVNPENYILDDNNIHNGIVSY